MNKQLLAHSMDKILRTTTPIKYPSYDHRDFHSTGFFLRTNHTYYLVTARHCLFESKREQDGPFRPDKISIRLRERTGGMMEQSHYRDTHSERIELYDADSNPNWIEPYHHNVDIAALPLKFSLSDTGNSAFGTVNLPTQYNPRKAAVPGESAIVAGYPILNRPTYAPILRNGLISSALDVDFDVQPYFLIDSRLHKGTSGSPVFVRGEDDSDRTEFTLIGVHSGRYDLSIEGSENLNRVWFLEFLRKRLSDLEPDPMDW